MIITRFGSPIRLVSVRRAVLIEGEPPMVSEVKIERLEDGSRLWTPLCNLKATNGFAEISDAIDAIEKEEVRHASI